MFVVKAKMRGEGNMEWIEEDFFYRREGAEEWAERLPDIDDRVVVVWIEEVV